MLGIGVRSWLVDRAPCLCVLWAASRPSQLALILLVYSFGVGMATVETPLVAGTGATTADLLTGDGRTQLLAGAGPLLSVAAAVHYANEYVDVETDALTTRTPFSGGSGALVRTGCPPRVLRYATLAAVGIAVCAIAGAALTATLSTVAIAFLLVLLFAGLTYSLPPVALIRRGVGELVNAVLGGIVLPLYGIAVVATPTADAALALTPFALVVSCSLLATHWPDREADAAVGKRTLVVRWPPGRIRRVYALLAATAILVTLWLWQRQLVPTPVALAHFAVVPLLGWGLQTVTRQHSPLPSVLAMVAYAAISLLSWWSLGIGS